MTWQGNYGRIDVEGGGDQLEHEEDDSAGDAANETSRTEKDVQRLSVKSISILYSV
jgi:hypothetical protein